MNQPIGNAISRPEPERVDDLTERSYCSYFVPAVSGAMGQMGQMSLVVFGSRQFPSAQIQSGQVYPTIADFGQTPPGRIRPERDLEPFGPARAGHCREHRLDSAAQIGLGERMHAWHGASGQRYVVSVYPPDAAPDYEDAVVLHIARARDCLRILKIMDGRDCVFTQPGEADEVHVHLMAQGAAARAALVADLLAG